jgi:Icc-related predicted phosphoesterase
MKLVLISDTHQKHRGIEVPACDVLIHAGDACGWGNEREFASFANWMEEQTQATHRIFSPGNHDTCVESDPNMARGMLGDTHLLIGQTARIEGGLVVHGIPWSPAFCNWSFQADDDHVAEGYPHIESYLQQIPVDTNILVTHGPPRGLLDKNCFGEECGSFTMRRWLDQGLFPDSLKLIVCGHIHEGAGACRVGDIQIINAAKDPNAGNPITMLDFSL